MGGCGSLVRRGYCVFTLLQILIAFLRSVLDADEVDHVFADLIDDDIAQFGKNQLSGAFEFTFLVVSL
jgi:hypothetical protein